MTTQRKEDPRLQEYLRIIERLLGVDYQAAPGDAPVDEIDRLGAALRSLESFFNLRQLQAEKLAQITAHVNAGLLFEEVMELIYSEFREVIPYNRIGVALIEEVDLVRALWAKSDQGEILLKQGYAQPLSRSSLRRVLESRQPRILNDLSEYLAAKPESSSTRLVVDEGMRSSLTCPLVANGIPVGFIFFSSVNAGEYANIHVETFQRIANDLSLILEKSRLVSELAARNAEIERQNGQLQRLIELRNVILGVVSHDLRSPLSYIQTSVDLMTGPDSGAYEQHTGQFLEGISRQVRRMKILLNDLLDFTAIEAGKLELEPEHFDLGRMLKETIDQHNQLAASKGTSIPLEIESAGQVYADPRRLRQVMDNLLTNAVKFSPPGSQVSVSAGRTGSTWSVRVRDQGPGIGELDRQRIFQAFSRLNTRPTGGEKGTGLGLAISRWIIEAHGGEIGVISNPGQGAEFWFTLPEKSLPDSQGARQI